MQSFARPNSAPRATGELSGISGAAGQNSCGAHQGELLCDHRTLSKFAGFLPVCPTFGVNMNRVKFGGICIRGRIGRDYRNVADT